MEMNLTTELERFAEDCVRSGRYESVAQVTQAAMRLLRTAETERAAFIQMLEDAEAEGERHGFLTIEEVEREMDEVIEATTRSQA